jgi:gamma-glutamyltranspeptidase / glutathione hydrolase
MQLEWAAATGDRSEGWLLEKRSEVMASRGMVTTSQPLAAEAGMRILQQGGNAIDAGVATAAVLDVTEPMNIGVGGDLFFIIYSARDHQLGISATCESKRIAERARRPLVALAAPLR